jgi:hypothetical protein
VFICCGGGLSEVASCGGFADESTVFLGFPQLIPDRVISNKKQNIGFIVNDFKYTNHK